MKTLRHSIARESNVSDVRERKEDCFFCRAAAERDKRKKAQLEMAGGR